MLSRRADESADVTVSCDFYCYPIDSAAELSLLAWLAQRARVLLAASVFIGLLLPELAALLRPLLNAAVIGTLSVALLRLDWQRLQQALLWPRQALLLGVWQLVLSPLLVWLATALLGLPAVISLSLILQAAAPPIGSAAVFALLLGIDASLTLVVAVTTVLALPLTLPPLIALLPDSTVTIDFGGFFLRVVAFVGAPFVFAGVLLRLCGRARLARHDDLLAALNVLLLAVFAIAVMDGVSARLWADPAAVAGLLFWACVMALLLHGAAYLLFLRLGPETALSAALCSGNRNMGLMLAITAGSAGPTFSIYVGLAQIPMYFIPLLLSALISRRAVDH